MCCNTIDAKTGKVKECRREEISSKAGRRGAAYYMLQFFYVPYVKEPPLKSVLPTVGFSFFEMVSHTDEERHDDLKNNHI